MLPITEHIRAEDQTATARKMLRADRRFRNTLNRHAELHLHDDVPATRAAVNSHHILGDANYVYIHLKPHLWAMPKNEWRSIVRRHQPAAAPRRGDPIRESRKITRRLNESCSSNSPIPVGFAVKGSAGNSERRFVQHEVRGRGVFSPTGATVTEMAPAIYKIGTDSVGNIIFSHHHLDSDQLLRFEDTRQKQILSEIDEFWSLAESYNDIGLVHKRGTLLFGPPGTGKSCVLKLVMEDSVNRGNLVIIAEDLSLLKQGLPMLRQAEPDRPILVILEDVDDMYEHALLQLFDGDSTIGGVHYLGTTNYVERLAPRVLRPGRFDAKIEVGPPPPAGRKAYFEQKLNGKVTPDRIAEFVKATNGFSFGQLREFLVLTYCRKHPPVEAARRMSNGGFLYESVHPVRAARQERELNKALDNL